MVFMKGMTGWLIVGGHIQVGYESEGPNGPDVFHRSALSKYSQSTALMTEQTPHIKQ